MGAPASLTPLYMEARTTRASPAEGATQEIRPAVIQAGIPRQRRKWSTTMNETIIPIFYRVTSLEQEMIGYSQQLHAEFCRECPQIQVTEPCTCYLLIEIVKAMT